MYFHRCVQLAILSLQLATFPLNNHSEISKNSGFVFTSQSCTLTDVDDDGVNLPDFFIIHSDVQLESITTVVQNFLSDHQSPKWLCAEVTEYCQVWYGDLKKEMLGVSFSLYAIQCALLHYSTMVLAGEWMIL